MSWCEKWETLCMYRDKTAKLMRQREYDDEGMRETEGINSGGGEGLKTASALCSGWVAGQLFCNTRDTLCRCAGTFVGVSELHLSFCTSVGLWAWGWECAFFMWRKCGLESGELLLADPSMTASTNTHTHTHTTTYKETRLTHILKL